MNSIPINYKNTFVCVEDAFLDTYYTTIDGCTKYKLVDGSLECHKCEGELILEDNQCKD